MSEFVFPAFVAFALGCAFLSCAGGPAVAPWVKPPVIRRIACSQDGTTEPIVLAREEHKPITRVGEG